VTSQSLTDDTPIDHADGGTSLQSRNGRYPYVTMGHATDAPLVLTVIAGGMVEQLS
jgi:hypothetical protein